jgi:hypothetical protein
VRSIQSHFNIPSMHNTVDVKIYTFLTSTVLCIALKYIHFNIYSVVHWRNIKVTLNWTHNRMNALKIVAASQADIHRFRNLNEKLFKCNANI